VVYALLIGATIVAIWLGISSGAADVGWESILAVIGSKLGLTSAPSARLEAIVWSIRMPRVILALAVGAGLAVSGAAMQGLFRNPLADPGLIGVSAGAAAGAVVALVARWLLAPVLGLVPEPLLVPIAAFCGGLLATWIVYSIATRDGHTSVATMLLAGIAVNAAAGALIGLMTYAADEAELRSLTLWTLGSVAAAEWVTTLGCVAVVVVAAGIFLRHHRAFDAFLLGETEAHALGIDTQRFQRWVVALTAVVVGVCVSFSGLIAFVGLVAPHIVRLWAGPSHRIVLPGSVLLGGAMLLGADTLARTIVTPAELPIGIVTSLLGAPFFIALLMRRRGGFL
jgi:iron complex transport system permease protein